jgi:phosphoribosylaminoimidazole-succinocarboxamide synthase
MIDVLLQTDLPLPLFIKGKVRDTYNLGSHLLIIATDRISAFDSVLPTGIPQKGAVLNQLSAFWFAKTANIVPNHVIEVVSEVSNLNAYLNPDNRFGYPSYLTGRSMVVKKAKRLPIECVVRGYLSGSAWTEYNQHGTVCSQLLPRGLRESEELPQPLFTPTTKADSGHDLPMSTDDVKKMLGNDLAKQIKDISLSVYNFARSYAREKGIIIADTKMEYGLDGDNLILIDELLTPDSSRFWDAGLYKVGQPQDSMDKQPLRDWLVKSGWNKEPPAPPLPAEVVEAISKKYVRAYERLTGRKLG